MGSINSNFIGNLKVGDNIKYNLQCLDSLYSDKKIRNKYVVKFAYYYAGINFLNNND